MALAWCSVESCSVRCALDPIDRLGQQSIERSCAYARVLLMQVQCMLGCERIRLTESAERVELQLDRSRVV